MMFENQGHFLLVVYISTLSRAALPVCDLEDTSTSKRLSRIYNANESSTEKFYAGYILNLYCDSDSVGEMEEVAVVCESTGRWSEDVVTYKSCPIPMYNNTSVIDYDGGAVTLACQEGCHLGEGVVNLTCGPGGVWSRLSDSEDNSTSSKCLCPCNRVGAPTADLQDEERIKQSLQQIKQSLKIGKNLTSSFLRKRISAEDQRPSAKGVGLIFGATILVLICCGILFVDLMCIVTQFSSVHKRIRLKKTSKD